jgi:cephalosporin hydroxylase
MISKVGIIKAELSVLDIQFLQEHIHEIELPNCYVEIGTRFGGSSLFARLANNDIDIYTIDPKPNWSLWKINPN